MIRQDRNQTFDQDGNLLEEQLVDVDITAESNEAAIRAAVRAHLVELRTIRDSGGTLTAAQLSAAVRALATGQIRVIRLLVAALDGTD